MQWNNFEIIWNFNLWFYFRGNSETIKLDMVMYSMYPVLDPFQTFNIPPKKDHDLLHVKDTCSNSFDLYLLFVCPPTPWRFFLWQYCRTFWIFSDLGELPWRGGGVGNLGGLFWVFHNKCSRNIFSTKGFLNTLVSAMRQTSGNQPPKLKKKIHQRVS